MSKTKKARALFRLVALLGRVERWVAAGWLIVEAGTPRAALYEGLRRSWRSAIAAATGGES